MRLRAWIFKIWKFWLNDELDTGNMTRQALPPWSQSKSFQENYMPTTDTVVLWKITSRDSNWLRFWFGNKSRLICPACQFSLSEHFHWFKLFNFLIVCSFMKLGAWKLLVKDTIVVKIARFNFKQPQSVYRALKSLFPWRDPYCDSNDVLFRIWSFFLRWSREITIELAFNSCSGLLHWACSIRGFLFVEREGFHSIACGECFIMVRSFNDGVATCVRFFFVLVIIYSFLCTDCAYFVEMFFELWSWIRDDFYLFFIIRPRHCLIMICDNCFDIAILLFFS